MTITPFIPPKCSNCTFWDPASASSVGGIKDVRKCTKAKMFWDSTEWFEADEYEKTEDGTWIERRFKPEAAGDLMFVQDGSDYTAMLITHADFFCAHFTTKTP